MNSAEFTQYKESFSFNALQCLRNMYYFNDCRTCIDICPEDAFIIHKNKLTLLGEKCTECYACIGSCPSEALQSNRFNENSYVLEGENYKRVLSCKNNVPCVNTFDSYHLFTMVLNNSKNLTCDLSECNECELNKENTMLQSIEYKINSVNQLLDSLKLPFTIERNSDKSSHDSKRRKLFHKIAETSKRVLDKPSEAISFEEKPPVKYQTFRHVIKENIESFEIEDKRALTPFIFNKKIEFQACTLCKDCMQFCPTDALYAMSDSQGILFNSSKCIGCEICNDICKEGAIRNDTEIDLVKYAFGHSQELVYYTMAMCQECRVTFPQKGSEVYCNRCKDFLDNRADLFTLAKDM